MAYVSSTDGSAGQTLSGRLNHFLGLGGEAPLHLFTAILLLFLCITAFLVSTPLGIALAFLLTLGLAIAMPASIPLILISAFLLQNMIIATFSPLVSGDSAFDTVRGVNFVILVAAYGTFLLATFIHPNRLQPGVRKAVLASLLVLAVVLFFLALGAVRGEPRDAIVYFRNTITPIACFFIAIIAASQYRVAVSKGIVWLGSLAIVYGYCELIFKFDFLRLFNGEQYVELQMARQIASGYWETALLETGFVLRNLTDLMMTDFFNLSLFKDVFPRVFRLQGPNFHPISFAYALSIIATWQLLRGKWLFTILAMPLLLVIGSKGAMVLLLLAICVKIGMKIMTPFTVIVLFIGATITWILAALVVGMSTGDYHVLGFFAGIREFVIFPVGQGLGIGGNLSSSTAGKLDWGLAQSTGSTQIPVESAIGVMLYQMGVFAFIFFGFILSLAKTNYKIYIATRDGSFLFGFVSLIVLTANAVLQEEAFYAPLVLGLVLTLVGTAMGEHYRRTESTAASAKSPDLNTGKPDRKLARKHRNQNRPLSRQERAQRYRQGDETS